ncbi:MULTISPECIES: serine hydrolase [unclassified Nocardia]|uniref:serine hydrolase n=1 Tax=unclassified Nocardia TaxID=2637762 RepID=UPI00210307FE|nr:MULTISPECIES: serine hydrolase [unclassified Nocardia]
MFAGVGVRGWVHARCLGCGGEVGVGADELVVLSSVVKLPLVVEFARQVAAGQVDPRDRVRAEAADRLGGAGTSGCADDVELSLRDAALFAMSVSDSTAADLLFDRVGLDNVRSLMRELGLVRTRIVGALRDLVLTMVQDLGASDAAEFAHRYRESPAAEIFAMRVYDPARTTASTPREMTRLLELIARDEAGPPQACRMVRELMGHQVNQQRLPAAFPADVAVWSKTGTLPGVRNEVGVVEFPDETRYAVAVFTRAQTLDLRRPDVDRVIGSAAAAAIAEIRHTDRCGT